MRLTLAILMFVAQLGIQGVAFAQSPYIQQCMEKEVPIPPKWGDPRWRKLKQNLPPEYAFDTEDNYPTTEVWVYGNDKGTCMALPRIDAAGKIQLLGIICLGKTGNACFWDNLPIGKKDRIKGENTKGMDPAKIQGANDLVEKCTDCHRGKNAFVVHPGTPLDPETWPKIGFEKREGAPDPKPDEVIPGQLERWYKPVSKNPAWINKQGTLGCGSDCHILPALTEGYCNLLAKEIGVTMPPDDDFFKTKKGDWRTKFTKAARDLKKECDTILPRTDGKKREWKVTDAP